MWEIKYKGDLIAIEKHSVKGFERSVRPPGVRLILENKNKEIIITKEFRSEQSKFDFRLPGGKVFDDLESYLNNREDKVSLEKFIFHAAKIEAKQEAGIDEIKNLKLISKSVAGASVEWDLYYVYGEIEEVGEQELDGDEKDHRIEIGFYSKDKVLEMLKSGEISEDRSVGVLFKYILG